jgi:hypothetical protein
MLGGPLKRRASVFIFNLLVATALLRAQNGQISGIVRDSSDALVASAKVELRNQQTGDVQTTTTNSSGAYLIPFAKPGVYRLSVSAPGFDTQTASDLAITVDSKHSFNFTLRPGEVQQEVSVSGENSEINTTDASVSTVVDRQFVSNIPLNGRSFQSLLAMVPGVNLVPSGAPGETGEFSVNGQRTESNYFTVDGVAANTGASPLSIGYGGGYGGLTATQTALGTTQSMLSVDALQEFRATTSTFSAEYGRTPGGQFSIVSRSGSNALHGTAYDYLRNEKLDANNTFNNANGEPRLAERQNDFGGTLGGPVYIPHLYDGRDKTFFFFSYEGLRLTTPVAASLTGVPSLALRSDSRVNPLLQTIFNSYPIPDPGTDRGNGLSTFTAGYSSPSQLDSTNVRIDHSFSDTFKIFGRFAHTPSSISARDAGDLAVATGLTGKNTVLTLGATNIFSPRLTNDFRFNVTQTDADSAAALTDFGGATPFPLTDIPGFTDPASDTLIFNFFYDVRARLSVAPAFTRQRQFNLVDTFSANLGRHALRFGFDFRRLRTTQSRPPLYEFAYVLSPEEIYANSMSGIVAQKYAGVMEPVYQNYSAFVQDDWKLLPRLSISYGVRWDVNPAPHDAAGNNPYAVTSNNPATLAVAAQNASLWKTRYHNFAPRLGVAYQANQAQGFATVLRAGGGIFYDLGSTNGTQGYSGLGSSATITPSGIPFPLTAEQISAIPAPNTTTPYSASVYAVDPRLRSPYTMQWNFAIEQELGQNQSLTVSYLGSQGRQLYLPKQYLPFYLGNANFSENSYLVLTNNGASSSYNALQIQFSRRLSHGLQALGSYTWSHAIDDATNNQSVFEQLRSSSDFDIRHNFQLALTYDIPGTYRNGIASALLKHWSLVTRITARSALPLDIIGYNSIGAGSAEQIIFHPNLVPGVPVYLNEPGAPGRRRINPAVFEQAFAGTGDAAVPVEGNLGRNALRAFDAVEANVAVQRDFPIHERIGLLLRVEAFNVLNHPVFGAIYNDLTQGPELFGTAYNTQNNQLGGLNSLYQTGGPRSLQVALKLHF